MNHEEFSQVRKECEECGPHAECDECVEALKSYVGQKFGIEEDQELDGIDSLLNILKTGDDE